MNWWNVNHLNNGMNYDSRLDFVESWLYEMPERIGSVESSYDTLVWTIRERIAAGGLPELVAPNLYKLEGKQVVLYWVGSPRKIDLAVELSRQPQSLVVNLLGKDPGLKTQPPYASDLYAAILDHSDVSLVMSDSILSNESINVWKRLVDQGYYVSVYNVKKPGKSRITMHTPQDLEKFLAADYHAWRFVLSKPGVMLEDVISFFNTRRYRELAGLDLGR